MEHLQQILTKYPKESQSEGHTEVTVVFNRNTPALAVMQIEFHVIFAFQVPQKYAYTPDDNKSANKGHGDHAKWSAGL